MSDPAPPDPQGGPDPGQSTPDEAEQLRKQLEDVKADNAKLREERRDHTATALAAKHGFGDKPTVVDLLKSVPADQMEAKAEALGAEFGKAAPPAETPPTEPPNPEELARMGASGQGEPAPPPEQVATGLMAQMEREVAEAIKEGDYSKVEAIQSKYRQLAAQSALGGT